MNELQENIIQSARSYLGTPWKHLGRTKNGIDCGGLVIEVAKNIGYKPIDFNTDAYARTPDGYTFINHFKEHLTQVPHNTTVTGDVLVIKSASRYPCHCGIFNRDDEGNETVIHSSAIHRMVVEQPYDEIRTKHVATFRFIM